MAYNHFGIPIFQKMYNFYKLIHEYRKDIPKVERYSLWPKIESACIKIIEKLLMVNQLSGTGKFSLLNNISTKIDLLRIFIRLAHEIKAIDNKKYMALHTLPQPLSDDIPATKPE